ncbi:MAG: PolC-type DNA polymerase III [Bdellovibrionales bacterium]
MTRITPWAEATFVAFDLETTGKYPLEAEICEVAAIKWQAGQIVDEYQTLVRPTRPMSDEVIAIHHITNDMVANAPPVQKVVPEFLKFLGGAVPVAHHAPFDMGFLAWEIENLNLNLPTMDALCTAVISRKALPASPNHRLQTLLQHLGLPQGQAHRALDDTKGCLQVALRCFRRIGENVRLEDLYKFQGVEMKWTDYSIAALSEKEALLNVVSAIRQKRHVELIYAGGSRPGQPRQLIPLGVVRNPNGDFLVAREPADSQTKRFFVSQIQAARVI